jgi:hypothetical protein
LYLAVLVSGTKYKALSTKLTEGLVSSSAPQIAVKIAYISSSITTVKSNITSVAHDLARVCSDFTTISAQLFPARTFSTILTQLPHVTTTINYITAKISPVATQVACVSPYFVPVSTKFTALPTIDISPLRRCDSARDAKHCQEHQNVSDFHIYPP